MVCLGFEPLGGKMESTDESTEHPCIALVLSVASHKNLFKDFWKYLETCWGGQTHLQMTTQKMIIGI